MTNLSELNDEVWFDMLVKSIDREYVDGVHFPTFPAPELQAAFVGSSNESALFEGFKFYKLINEYLVSLAESSDSRTRRFLDFGCGWGRFLRIFRKDFDPANMHGVDVDPSILDICRQNLVPGQLQPIESVGSLPYPNDFFDLSVAYSVFTHLPEQVHLHWIKEISRVMKSGGIFALTMQPDRFLDFIEALANKEPAGSWHANLSRFSNQIPEFKDELSKGKFVYIPTGGGDYRSADVYGEAVVPESWVKFHWSNHFEIVDIVDDKERFNQKVIIARKPIKEA